MARFAAVDGGEIINIDHVVKVSEVPVPGDREAFITLEMVNGNTVTASGTLMDDIKRYVFRNSIVC